MFFFDIIYKSEGAEKKSKANWGWIRPESRWWLFPSCKRKCGSRSSAFPPAAGGMFLFIVAHSETNRLAVMMMVVLEGGGFSLQQSKLMIGPALSWLGWTLWPVSVVCRLPGAIDSVCLHEAAQQATGTSEVRDVGTESGREGIDGVMRGSETHKRWEPTVWD